MAPLPTDLRKILENAVVDARRKAEAGAGAVLTNLAVFASQPYASMDGSARRLRVALRARASALGDGYGDLDKGKAPLSEEIAYEAWHRMLFARFLAENELLMHESGAPLSIDLCDELAREERTQRGNTVDAWDIAARYASDMLPGIFKADDPSSRAAARFAPEDHIALERIVTGLPADVFTADDSLGWIYQFWQREAKNEVNASERKIGGKDLAPVTQLFTEHYMVRFLLENSLGAWWAARHPDSPLIATFDYLRFREDGTPAAGTFPGWPERAAEVTVMDPCCGSGHFLVAAFEMLRRMRMEEEGLDEVAAGDAVLRDNLFGLELDPRCTQIAAFALAFATWKAGGYRELPLPHVACSGIAVTGQLDAWRKLARGDFKLTSALERLYNLFRDASTLGSLIDPNAIPIEDRMFTAEFDQVAPFLERALARERSAEDPTSAVFGEAALGVVQAAELLAGRYTLVATNVPYLSRGSHDEMLRTFIDTHFPASKADLATVFVERCRAFTRDDGQGSYAVVTPQNWLFLTSYRKLREKLLHEQEWDSVTRLGEGGFESHAAAGAFTVLLILTNQWPNADHLMTGIDASEPRMVAEKAMFMRDAELQVLSQEAQLGQVPEVL